MRKGAEGEPRLSEEHTSDRILPRTGMAIPFSPLRATLQEITQQADAELYQSWREGAATRAARHYDDIAKVAGFSIVEKRNPEDDYRYRCAEYAFKKEPWKIEGYKSEKDGITQERTFWTDPEQFITERGYDKLMGTPEDGDIIAYGLNDLNEFVYNHFGTYQGIGKVVSKFERGHVYKHPWHLVPEAYGDQVVFFRKIGG